MSKSNIFPIIAAFLVGLFLGLLINTNKVTDYSNINNTKSNSSNFQNVDKTKLQYEYHIKTYYIQSDLANVRLGPSVDSTVINTLKKGYKFISESKYDDWIKISDSKGWIHQSLLTTNYVSPPPDIKIIEISSRVTEQNNSWWRYAWKLTVKNNSDTPKRLNAIIQFKDIDDYVIDDDNAYDLFVPAGEERTFTDYALVNYPDARRVEKTSVSVEW